MVGSSAIAMGNGGLDIDAIEKKMVNFNRSDTEREQLLNQLLKAYQDLNLEHTHLQADFENERNSRRLLQDEARRASLQLKSVESLENQNSFVLALIDGDGVIFQDALLRAGAEGGSEAASKLHAAIRDHVTSLYDNSAHWPVMAHIYLSLDKLGEKLYQVGLLNHPIALRAFCQSFNMNQPLFHIIDVGQGKERADYKIKEMLRTYDSNPTCRHIIFGGCHDAGYLIQIEQYKHNQARADHITLLESTPPYRGFAGLPFKRTHFDAVFKSEPLPDHGQFTNGHSHAQPPKLAKTLTDRSISPPISTPSPVHVLSPPAISTTKPSVNASQSWAAVGKASTSSGNVVNIASRTQTKKKYIYYNEAGYRLDEPLGPKDPAAFQAIESRMKKHGKNLCNNYHLNGTCPDGDKCRFQHGTKLTAYEKIALNYKTRQLPCKYRTCDIFECYLGHQCANERDQGHCQYGSSCHLRDSHGMDKTKFARYDKDGNVEYL